MIFPFGKNTKVQTELLVHFLPLLFLCTMNILKAPGTPEGQFYSAPLPAAGGFLSPRIETKPLEILFASGSCLWCGVRLMWLQAGLVLGWGVCPPWSSRYSLSHRHTGFLQEDKELYPNLLFRITDVLMSAWSIGL